MVRSLYLLSLCSIIVLTDAPIGTFYDVGLGACGVTNVDTDYIVAVSTTLYDTYP